MIKWAIAAGGIRDEHETAARIRFQNISAEDGALAEWSIEAIPLFVLVTHLKQLRPARISQDSIRIIVVSGVVVSFVAENGGIGGGDFRKTTQRFPTGHRIRVRVC